MNARKIALSLLLLAACNQAPEAPSTPFTEQTGSGDTGTTADTTADTGGSGQADTTADTDGSADFTPEYQTSINGTWLHLSQVSTCVYFLRYFEQYVKSLYIVHTEQDAFGVVNEHWEGCANDLTPVLNVQPSTTPAILATSHQLDTTGLFDGTNSGDFFGTSRSPRIIRDGDGYASGPLVELWGVRMDDPLRDPFPTSADDPRITDTDGDGKLAVTLPFSSGCEAYLAQRTTSYHQGTFIASDRMKGKTISASKQLIIDATEPLCKAGYEVNSNPGRSFWERVRIDGEGGARNADLDGNGTITCDEAKSVALEIFKTIAVDNECCDPTKAGKACCNPDIAVNDPCCDPAYARANRDLCPAE